VKRLLALLAGVLGLRAVIRRRRAPAADELRAKLAEARTADVETDAVPPPADEPTAVEDSTVDERRADVHARARRAIDELGD
jgi:hypothetical protein